jgi:hypothetical protein
MKVKFAKNDFSKNLESTFNRILNDKDTLGSNSGMFHTEFDSKLGSLEVVNNFDGQIYGYVSPNKTVTFIHKSPLGDVPMVMTNSTSEGVIESIKKLVEASLLEMTSPYRQSLKVQ